MLFVYGSLRSGESAAALLDAFAVSRIPARTRGSFVDTGTPYPGVIFGAGEFIIGEVVVIDPTRRAEAFHALDHYEGRDYKRREIEVEVEEAGVYKAARAISYEWRI